MNFASCKILYLLLVLISLLFSNASYSTKITDYRFKLLTTADGLPSSEITKIYQQSSGYIWVGTDRGLARFDGYDFKHFKYSPGSQNHISNDFINDILEDTQGNIWVSTESGLNVIRPNGSIDVFRHQPGNPNSIPTNWTTSLYLDNEGIVWIGTGSSLIRLDPKTMTFSAFKSSFSGKYEASAAVYGFVELETGEMLIATTAGLGTVSKTNKTYSEYLVKNSAEILYDKFVTSLLLYKNNLLVLGTETDGLILYDIETGIKTNFRHKPGENGLSENSISALTLDQFDNLWIGYSNNGLSVNNLQNFDQEKMISIEKKDFEPFSLSSNAVRVLFIDKSGLIWIGTDDGITQYSHLTTGTRVYFKRPDKSQLSSNKVYSVYKDIDSGLAWVTSDNGLMALNSESDSVFHYPLINNQGQADSVQEVWQIANAGPDHFWLAAESGLLLFDKQTLKSTNITESFGMKDRAVYTLLPTSDRSLWITGYLDLGLLHLDIEKGITKQLLNTDKSKYMQGDNFTTAKIVAGDGSLMLATSDGVYRIDRNDNEIHYPLSDHREFIRTTSIIETQRGEFWVGTHGLGLVQLILDDDGQAEYNYFGTKQGFPSNDIQAVRVDRNDLWFLSRQKLFKMNLIDKKIQSFPDLFSVPQLTFAENGMTIEGDTLYLASSRGLLTIDKSNILNNLFEAPIRITEVVSSGSSILGNRSFSNSKKNELEYQDNDIEIFFAALDYRNPSNILYSFKLEGIDSSWSEPTSRRSALYSNLSFGEYVFKVKGTNSSALWSNEIAEFRFTVLKPWWFYLILVLAISTFLTLSMYAVNRRKQISFLHEKAHIDNLTRVSNRFSFNKKLDSLLDSNCPSFGLAIIDLDSFKEVNDTFGHHVGDTLLTEVTKRINKNIRNSDFVARLGGDEFALIMTKFKKLEDLIEVTERLRVSLEKDYDIAGNEIAGSSSIGVSVYPQDGADPETLLTHADAAMYEAKKCGKNRVYFFNQSLSESLSKKLRIRANLRPALNQNQFQLYYQPKYNQFTKALVGAEALIRWIHPEDGFIPPDQFIQEAERNGTIIEIGNWVLEEACNQIKAWHERYGCQIRISVNVSAVQISKSNFVRQVRAILKKTKVDPTLIELEITESVLIESRQACQQTFEELQSLGITIALDDFGVGFSSLSYLTLFTIDTLKIDRSFVNGLESGSQNYMVLKNIYSLAQDLDMQVVAEGVEDKTQLDIIAEFNGAIIQGYYFSPPLNSSEFEKRLHKQDRT